MGPPKGGRCKKGKELDDVILGSVSCRRTLTQVWERGGEPTLVKMPSLSEEQGEPEGVGTGIVRHQPTDDLHPLS